MNARTKSSRATLDSEKVKLKRDKFALLAKVGQRKREASQYHDEAEFYFGIVTDLLVVLRDAMAKLRTDYPPEKADALVTDLMSRHTHLMRQLLSYWPQNTASQLRALTLLDCDGLATVTTVTEGGYVSLSSDQILENVERIIEATKAASPKQSSS